MCTQVLMAAKRCTQTKNTSSGCAGPLFLLSVWFFSFLDFVVVIVA